MKYTYIGNGSFYSGLPMRDLDDQDLSPEQQKILAEAVAHGMYVAEKPATKSSKKAAGKDDTEDS